VPRAPHVYPERLALRDRLQILNSVLMPALGAVVVARAWLVGGPLLTYLFGLALVGLGVYRLKHVIAYLQAKHKQALTSEAHQCPPR
jgi:hypothetical protein